MNQYQTACVLISLLLIGDASLGQTEDATEKKNTLARSARVSVDRNVSARLNSARELVDQGEFATAIGILQDVLNLDQDVFVTEQSTLKSAKSIANRIIAGFSSGGARLYEQQVGNEARSQVARAIRNGDVELLTDVSIRFRNTSSGYDASKSIAARAFDRGRFEQAASAYRRLIAHPRFDPTRDSATVVRLIVSELRCGKVAKAKMIYERYREHLLGSSIRIGGELKQSDRWLADRIAETSTNAEQSSDWPIPRGNVTRNRISKTDRPLSIAKWEYKTEIHTELQAVVADSLKELRDYGIANLSSQIPILVNDQVIARTADRLIAFDAATGETRWQRLFDNVWSQHGSNSQFLLNPNFRTLVAESLSQQIQSDSVTNTMASDGTRLYLIEPTKQQNTRRTFRRRQPPGAPPGMPSRNATKTKNQLSAIDLANGETIWSSSQIGADVETCYLGTPLPIGDSLYSIGQRGPNVVLSVVAASDGREIWSILLAIESESLLGNPRRRGNACPIAVAEGIAICPTGSGIVVAVDLLTRQALWAFRYDRTDHVVAQPDPLRRSQVSVRQKWWNGWRDSAAIIDGERVVVAPAESNRLFAFNIRTGALLWNQPRDSGLSVLGISKDKLLILEEYSVRARSIETGETVWESSIGASAGRGFINDTQCVLPLRRGGFAAIALSDGKVQTSLPANKRPAGNLVPVKDGVISQSFGRVAFLPELARSLQDANDDLVTNALIHRENRQFDKAISLLRKALDKEGDAAVRRHLFETLLSRFESEPSRWKTTLQEAIALIEEPHDQVRILHAAAIAAAGSGDSIDSLKLLLELSALNPDGEFDDRHNVPRVVRYDRLIQGLITRIQSQADQTTGGAIDKLLSKRQTAAQESLDPFAKQRFASQFGQLKWGQRFLTDDFDKATVGVRFLKSQLPLLELAASSDRAIAATATHALAQLYEARSFRIDAAAQYRRLSGEFADVQFPEGKTGSEIVDGLSQDSLVRTALETSAITKWSEDKPTVTILENKPHRSDVYFRTIRVDSEHGSLLDRITVSVHRTGGSVRFQGDGQHGAWTLKLPDSKSPFRRYGHGLYRGWGLGHLLVLQVGTEIFGIAPINNNGEPRAELMWSLNMLEGVRHAGSRTLQMRKGFGFDELQFFDDFDWTIGQVTVVRPGYIVYRERAKLVAIDPASGAKLWQRFDVPRQSEISGDDAVLAIWQPAEQNVEFLSVIDGSTTQNPSVDFTRTQALFQRGRYWIVESKSSTGLQISRVDVANGRKLWSTEFPVNNTPFSIDSKTFGILQPDGIIKVIARQTGKSLGTINAELPAKLSQIRCAVDEQHVYIVLSGPLSNPAKPAPQRAFGDYRNPWVNGTLYCLDRKTFKLNWSQTLTDITFALDQHRDMPFLLSNYRKQQKTENGRTTVVTVIECFDKRTGKPILKTTINFQPVYAIVNPNPGKQQVEVHTPTRTIQIKLQSETNKTSTNRN